MKRFALVRRIDHPTSFGIIDLQKSIVATGFGDLRATKYYLNQLNNDSNYRDFQWESPSYTKDFEIVVIQPRVYTPGM